MIEKLLKAMDRLASLNFDARLTAEKDVGDADEALVDAFNRMQETLRAQFDALSQLATQAYYDTLTGLPNRQLFRDRLDRELARSSRTGELVGLMYIDLDHFKRVNDTLGHAAGDELLKAVAVRLHASVKETDTVARLGGDEFIVLLPELANPEAAGRIAERIMQELSKPLQLRGQEFYAGASIGVALCPEDGKTADELIRNADTAMYRAKKHGRSRIMFYEAHMNTRAVQRWNLETGLHQAVETRQFELYYQPQVELAGGALSSAEALIRWNSPKRGQRTPADFIPVAEQSGLIHEIGNWALNEVCRQYAHWRREGEAPPRLSLNISAEQLQQPGFLEVVRNALLNSDVPPWALELDLKETVLLTNLERTRGTVAALAEMGVRLAVDDFGTGLSSLSCLRHYPIEIIKIDRSFVTELPDDREIKALTGAIVTVAHSLNKQTIAEGVETEDQYFCLKAIGCDFAQGYYFAKPMPAAEFRRYMMGLRGQPGGMPAGLISARMPA